MCRVHYCVGRKSNISKNSIDVTVVHNLDQSDVKRLAQHGHISAKSAESSALNPDSYMISVERYVIADSDQSKHKIWHKTSRCQNRGITKPLTVTLPNRRVSLMDVDVGRQLEDDVSWMQRHSKPRRVPSAVLRWLVPLTTTLTILFSSPTLDDNTVILTGHCVHAGEMMSPAGSHTANLHRRTNATHVVNSLPFVYGWRLPINSQSKLGRVWPEQA